MLMMFFYVQYTTYTWYITASWNMYWYKRNHLAKETWKFIQMHFASRKIKDKKNLWDPRLKFICPFGQTFFYCISTCFSHMWVGWQQGKQWLIGCSSYIKPLSATYKVPFSMYGNFFEIYCSTFLWNIQKDFNFHILWAMVHLKSNVDF